MDVIWTYGLNPNKADTFGEIPFCLLMTSVESWKRHYPEVRRVLFVDRTVHQDLCQKEVLGHWNEVKVLDFQEELNRIGYPDLFKASWAIPKILTMRLVEKSTWIVDVDTYLYKRFDNILDNYDILLYSYYDNDEEAIYNSVKLPERLRGNTACFNGGLSFYRYPDDCKMVANTVLETMEYCRKQGVFDSEDGDKFSTYCEEGILGKVVLEGNRRWREIGFQNEWCFHHLNKTEDGWAVMKDLSKWICMYGKGN